MELEGILVCSQGLPLHSTVTQLNSYSVAIRLILMLSSQLNSTSSSACHVTLNWRVVVNDEFGRMWIESVIAYFKVLFQHLRVGEII
jgi:hypothetical protein